MIGREPHLGVEFARQALHGLVVGAAGEVDLDDLLRLRGERQVLEEANPEPAPAKRTLDAESGFRMAGLPARELFGDIGGERAQFAGPAQMPVNIGAEDHIERGKAMIRIMVQELV